MPEPEIVPLTTADVPVKVKVSDNNVKVVPEFIVKIFITVTFLLIVELVPDKVNL